MRFSTTISAIKRIYSLTRNLLWAICVVVGATLPLTASATDITWTGAVSSDWNNSANWTPQQVPSASDHVIINSGTLAIPADAGFAIMDWTGGTINGALNVASNGVLNVGYGPENKILDGTLTNAGTVVVTVGYGGPGNNLYLGRIYNLAGGLFDIQNDTWLVPYIGPAFFNNAGTMRKSGGTGTTDIDVEFTTPASWRRIRARSDLGEAAVLAEISRP